MRNGSQSQIFPRSWNKRCNPASLNAYLTACTIENAAGTRDPVTLLRIKGINRGCLFKSATKRWHCLLSLHCLEWRMCNKRREEEMSGEYYVIIINIEYTVSHGCSKCGSCFILYIIIGAKIKHNDHKVSRLSMWLALILTLTLCCLLQMIVSLNIKCVDYG